MSSLPHRATPSGHPSLIDPPPPVSSRSRTDLGPEGATALISGLTALTSLQSIDIRSGEGRREARASVQGRWSGVRARTITPSSISCMFFGA